MRKWDRRGGLKGRGQGGDGREKGSESVSGGGKKGWFVLSFFFGSRQLVEPLIKWALNLESVELTGGEGGRGGERGRGRGREREAGYSRKR